MKIAVIGTGYVGLVAGTCFAETGNEVICVDNDPVKLKQLKRGQLSIYEPDLDLLFSRNIKAKRLTFSNNLALAVDFAQVIFLALPTPSKEDSSADLSYILKVAKKLGTLTDNYKIYVNKSTVPVGTSDKVKACIAETPQANFDVISNPEFLREGFAVRDFLKPDRIVIGTSSEKAKTIMTKLYKPFVRQGNPIYFVDERSAEMIKYTANAYLATRVTFMNEIANLCEKVGADAEVVRVGVGSDQRIGNQFLYPGLGYGGSCFPKDVKALAKTARDQNYDFQILKAVMAVNQQQPFRLLQKIEMYFGKSFENETFAIWGLSFKPNTDDIREAPALTIIDYLLDKGAKIKVFDEAATDNVRQIYGAKIHTYGKDNYTILENASALIIVTEWNIFKNPDFQKMKTLLKNPLIFDGRNLFSLQSMQQYEFQYFSVGRTAIKS